MIARALIKFILMTKKNKIEKKMEKLPLKYSSCKVVNEADSRCSCTADESSKGPFQ